MDHTPQSLLDRLATCAKPEDWSTLDALYRPLLSQWVRSAVPQASDAEDVIQETMTVVVAKVAEFRHGGTKGVFRSWLRSILVRKVKDFWRKQGRVPATNDPHGIVLAELERDASDLAKNWDAEHDRHVVNSLLERIRGEFTPSSWQIFELYVLKGLTPNDVATKIGVSANAVFIARSRILQRLREEADGLVAIE